MLARTRIIASIALPAVWSAAGSAQTIEFSGTDHTGHISMSCLKNWGDRSFAEAPTGLPDYPVFFKPDGFDGQGVWTSLVAEPLSPDAVYPEEQDLAPGEQIFNQFQILDADYADRNIGRIIFDPAEVSGVGYERLTASQVSIEVDGADFSPITSTHNAGSGVGNAGWDYVITVSNLIGGGVDFCDGQPIFACLEGDVSIIVRFLGIDDGAFPNAYNGRLRVSGNRFEFDVDVTQDNVSLLGPLTDTRLVMTRAGTIDAIDPGGRCPIQRAGAGGTSLGLIQTYIAWYLAGDPRGDTDGDGRITVFDMLQFLRSATGTPVVHRPACIF